MIAVIDIGIGNVGSLTNSLSKLNFAYHLVSEPYKLPQYEKIILPGVGSFSSGSEKLFLTGMAQAIVECVKKGVPILGICLGMQLLTCKGNENRESKGLGLINAEVIKIKLEDKKLHIPHMGWNDVISEGDKLFNEIKNGSCFYFVHSYECMVFDSSVKIAYTDYGRNIVAGFSKDNVYGVQFHPEKSQSVGLRLLRNFITLC